MNLYSYLWSLSLAYKAGRKVHIDFAEYMHVVSCSLQIAVDSIENIRTVAALGVEDNFFLEYKKSVKAPYK